MERGGAFFWWGLLLLGLGWACGARPVHDLPVPEDTPVTSGMVTQTATMGGGCFWCVEAVFQSVRGVLSVEPGYCGGSVPDPTYAQVCRGDTGHAEAVQVRFDPAQVSYREILEIFFATHDPTTLNRQGADVGTQYRSVIFYHDAVQEEQAARAIGEARESWQEPVVTTLEPLAAFYPAEAEHRDYFARNPNQGYCSMVIAPKLRKFRQKFGDRLKNAE